MPEIDMREGYDPVTIRIYDRKKDLVTEETSLIALDRTSNRVTAVGNEVKPLLNTINSDRLVVCPLKHGMIADYGAALVMFRGMLGRASILRPISKPKITVCVPPNTTEVERKAFEDVFYKLGAGKIWISEKALEEAVLSMPSACHAVVAIAADEKREPSGSEVWREVCKDKLPSDRYRISQIRNQGPERIMTLLGGIYRAELIFHNVIAMRMLEKDVVPQELFSEHEIKKFRKDQFRNVIYQIDDGELDRFLTEGIRGKARMMNKYHYLIVCADDMVEIMADEGVDVVV